MYLQSVISAFDVDLTDGATSRARAAPDAEVEEVLEGHPEEGRQRKRRKLGGKRQSNKLTEAANSWQQVKVIECQMLRQEALLYR